MYNKRTGFTLIELSIVLIIIGLIIGGVLVGQDMIKSAEIRSTLQQIEKYNTAVNTFRGKYGGIPGDLTAQKAASYGMVTRSGADGHGDGDGRLEACATNNMADMGCETLIFWRDLSFANLIEGSFTSATDDYADGGVTIGPSASSISQFFPTAAIGRGNYFTAHTLDGQNYYALTGLNRVLASGAYILFIRLTPAESFSMDNKVDDGIPGIGIVRALSDLGSLDGFAIPAAPAVGVCVSDAVTPNPYNTSTADFANSSACQLQFRFN